MRKPIYEKIAADIREQIRSGKLQPGAELPSVSKLREQYECSTTAVRNAMLVLRTEGLIESQQGKAVYVAER